MSDKVKIFKRSDKYRENWDRIFKFRGICAGCCLGKTEGYPFDEEYKHIAYGAYLENGKIKLGILAACCVCKTEGIGPYDLIEASEDPLTKEKV